MSMREKKRKRDRIKFASQDYNHLKVIEPNKRSRSSMALDVDKNAFSKHGSGKKKKKSSSRKRGSVYMMNKGSSLNNLDYERKASAKMLGGGSVKKRKKRAKQSVIKEEKEDTKKDEEIIRLNGIIESLRKENEILKQENEEFSRKFQMMKEIYSEVNGTSGGKKKNKSRRKDFEELLSADSDMHVEDGSKNERSGRNNRIHRSKKSRRAKLKKIDENTIIKLEKKTIKKQLGPERSKKHRKATSDTTHITSSRYASNAASESLPAINPLVYGIPLKDVELGEDKIPVFLKNIADELIRRGIHVEGILRVSGSSTDIKKYQNELDCGDTEIDFSVVSVHTLAGLLKLFFRQLPAPIIPPLFNAQIPLILEDLKEGIRKEKSIVQDFKDVVYSLPEPNLTIYLFLGKFLHAVWQNEATNKMNITNILTCVCPSIRIAPALMYYTIKFIDFFMDQNGNLCDSIADSETTVLDLVNSTSSN